MALLIHILCLEIREQSVESSHGTFDDKSLLERDSSISTAETNRDEQPILDKKGRIEVMREKVKQELGETNYLKVNINIIYQLSLKHLPDLQLYERAARKGRERRCDS